MIYLGIGRRGRGKSTLVYHYARKFAQRIIVDPRNQFRASDALRVRTPEDVESALDGMWADPSISEIVIVPLGAPQECFDALMDALRAWIDADLQERRPLAIIIDEARFFDLETESFQWVARCAPRETVHVFITTHRPHHEEIPTSVQSIADKWFVFHTTQKHDLKAIDDRCGPDVTETVRKLAAYQFVLWDDGAGEWKAHTNSRDWYVPLKEKPQPVTVRKHRAGRIFG